MKNFILYSLILSLGLLSFSSCEDDSTQDMSVITYYATLELEGDATLFWDLDEPYVEPGYTAEMQGEDVTDQVKISGSVDETTPGVYTLTYSIINEDGFSTSKSRLVMVFDPTPSLIESGFWTTDPESYRDYNGKTTYGRSFTISILQTAPGVFYISDFLGGWYDQRTGYGPAYAMTGTFQLNEDNTITPLSSNVEGWGDSMDEMMGGKFDPETGSISWGIGYGGDSLLKFYVTLTK